MARPGGLRRLLEGVIAAADLPDAPLVVGLSGGADSAALAFVAREAGLGVRAVHVHHGLPGSEVMAEAARAVASSLDLDLEVAGVEVGPGASLEAQARTARYRALEDALLPGEWLGIAHTRDDQVETVLINLLRGAGVDGLAGMPARRLPLIRPLLGVSRTDTRRLATLAGLAWRDDPTNADLGHLRNRIRRRLLPELEGTYAASIRELLVRTAETAASDAALLDRETNRIRIEEGPQGLRVARGDLMARRDLAPRVLRRMLAQLSGEAPTRDTVRRVLAVAAGEVGSLDLPDGLVARREGPWLVIAAPHVGAVSPPATLGIPGVTTWGRWRVEVGTEDRPAVFPLSPVAAVLGEGEAVVRASRAGDRIDIGTGSKPVREALAEAGVPPERRDGWPVVEVDGVVVWIPGVRRAPFVGPPPERYLCAVAWEEPAWHVSGP